MNQPTLDYWSGPSHPTGWRTGLFWSYAGGVAVGITARRIIGAIFASGGRQPDMCLTVITACIGTLISASLFFLAVDLRVRLLRHKYHVRGRPQIAIVGCLYPLAVFCVAYLGARFAPLGPDQVFFIVFGALFFAYHALAAVILIRPGDPMAPVTSAAPSPDQDIPLAQLADPPAATPPAPAPQPDNSPPPPVQ